VNGQVAIVTGAGGGIGGAIARAIAAQGAQVFLAGRDRNRLQAVADRIAFEGSPAARIAVADLDRDDEVASLAATVLREAGGVDVLVHCAGLIALGPVAGVTVAEFDRMHRVNVRAPYLLTQALLPALRERRGQVVFVNSSAGLSAGANAGAYAATKHALRAIADSLRHEVNDDGVRVTSIYPGRTASAMQAAVHRHEGRTYDPARLMQPEDVAAAVQTALSLPRTAEIADLHVRSMRKPA
jgi:NADP-dependent 3-hydroxy acid dehydrogenase YdfG